MSAKNTKSAAPPAVLTLRLEGDSDEQVEALLTKMAAQTGEDATCTRLDLSQAKTLSDDNMGKVAKQIETCLSIKDFMFARCAVPVKGFKAFCEALMKRTTQQIFLNAQSSSFRDGHLSALLPALESRFFASLILSNDGNDEAQNNEFSGDAMTELFATLSRAQFLRTLHLPPVVEADCSERLLAALALMLRKNKSVKSLSIKRSKADLGKSFIAKLDEEIENHYHLTFVYYEQGLGNKVGEITRRNRQLVDQIAWKSVHPKLLDFAMVFAPLLPPYCALHIFDYLPLMHHVRHGVKIELIVNVAKSIQKIHDAKVKAKK